MNFLIVLASFLVAVAAKPGVVHNAHVASHVPTLAYSSIPAHTAPGSVAHHVAVAHHAPVFHNAAIPAVAHHAPVFHHGVVPSVAHYAPVFHHGTVPAIAHHVPAFHHATVPAVAGVIPAIATDKTQYHAQDIVGQASYGHTEAFQHHHAVQDAAGNKVGSYSWVAPDGQVIAGKYVADALGYRVHSNAIPVGPTPVIDTPEVVAARSAHIATHHHVGTHVA